ncbi:unnamed protein product, partial [marine sediment metagenome]
RQERGWGCGEDVAARVGINRKTAENYGGIASQYEFPHRWGNLTFKHHMVVAYVSEPRRTELLQWAEETGASSRELLKKKNEVLLDLRDPELTKGKFRVIYADPPWKYGDERVVAGYTGTAAQTHYPTMSVEEICDLDIGDLADVSCVLFCWATFPLLPDAIRVVDAWGFTYKTAMVWDKQRPNMGNYHDASAELLIIATRGSALPGIRPCQVQSVKREGRHSEKPEHFRELIDSMYENGTRIELFRRGGAPTGWHVWGNEADV